MRDLLRHFFLPHHTNNHRPKILHHEGLSVFVVLFLAIAFFMPPLQKEYPQVLGISVNVSTADLLALTNQKRAESGLPPLVLNPQLSSAAAEKAKYMIEKNFWAHVAPDGTTPWYFIKNSGYEYLYAGENLARGYNSASDVINAWMASPSHRDNIMSPHYNDIGFAVTSGTLTGSDTVLVVEEFGSKYQSKEVASQNNAPVGENIPSISPVQSIQKAPAAKVATARSSNTAVAAAVNAPLVDTKSTTHNIAIFVITFFIVILVIDGLIIERKKIVRVVAHNLDHIIFLSILLIAALIIGKGVIL